MREKMSIKKGSLQRANFEKIISLKEKARKNFLHSYYSKSDTN